MLLAGPDVIRNTFLIEDTFMHIHIVLQLIWSQQMPVSERNSFPFTSELLQVHYTLCIRVALSQEDAVSNVTTFLTACLCRRRRVPP